MAGTVEGGRKAAATSKKRYGEDHFARMGAKGGKLGGGKGGFKTMDKDKLKAAGSKGGKISKRTKRA